MNNSFRSKEQQEVEQAVQDQEENYLLKKEVSYKIKINEFIEINKNLRKVKQITIFCSQELGWSF